MSTEIDIDAMEARYFEILRRVCQGEGFTITVDGEAVAEVVPVAKRRSSEEVAAAVEGLLNMPRIEGISGETVREWIQEGRR